jgi:hypothetical protein
MKVRPKVVSVELHENEALQIISALNIGLKDKIFDISDPDFIAAHRLKEILTANFESSITGVHIPHPITN